MNNDTAAYHARHERGEGHMPPGEGAAFANGAAARQPEIDRLCAERLAFATESEERKAEIERLLKKNIELRQQAECDQREVERLTAQNANLRRWQALGKPLTAAMSIVVDDMQELRADNERLRAALKPLAEWAIDVTAKPTLADCDRARRALETKP
jgi:hypothetical protein